MDALTGSKDALMSRLAKEFQFPVAVLACLQAGSIFYLSL